MGLGKLIFSMRNIAIIKIIITIRSLIKVFSTTWGCSLLNLDISPKNKIWGLAIVPFSKPSISQSCLLGVFPDKASSICRTTLTCGFKFWNCSNLVFCLTNPDLLSSAWTLVLTRP